MMCLAASIAAETGCKLWGIVLAVSMYLGPQQIWRMFLFCYLQAEVALYERRIIAYLRMRNFEEESLMSNPLILICFGGQ